MRSIVAALAAVGIAGGAWAQDGDKIGKDKAPAVAKKVVAEVQKRKSAAITQGSAVSLPLQSIAATFTGVSRKEFAAVKGSAEVYARGHVYLVRSGDAFQAPETLKGQEAMNALAFKNPSLVLAEVGRVAAAASYLNDEPWDGKDCKVLSLAGDEEHVKQHLRELGARLGPVIRGLAGGFDPGNLAAYFETKTSKSTYKVWVGKADLLVYKVEWVFTAQPKHGSGGVAGAPPLMMSVSMSITFSKWDEDIPFEIPGPVKSKFGMK